MLEQKKCIYPLRTILFASLIGGIATAAIMIGQNYRKLGKLNQAGIVILFLILGYLPFFVIARRLCTFLPEHLFNESTEIFVLFLTHYLLQPPLIVIAWLFWKKFHKTNNIPQRSDIKFSYPIWKILIIIAIGIYINAEYWRGFYFFSFIFCNWYLYTRALLLFKKPLQTKIIAAILIAFTGSRWLGGFLAEFTNWYITRYFVIAGSVYRAAFFYIFIAVFIFHCIMWINQVTKLFSKNFLYRKKAQKIMVAVLLISTLMALISGYYNTIYPRVNTYRIAVPKQQSKLDSLGIVLITDYHLIMFTPDNFVKTITDSINSKKPDIVLIAGDIIDNNVKNIREKPFCNDLRKIQAKYGVYAVAGNHEYYGEDIDTSVAYIENCGIDVLEDEVTIIDSAFYLIGRDDQNNLFRKTEQELFTQVTENLPVIFMQHRPPERHIKLNSKIDVMVSGHTHNGYLFPFNWVLKLLYKVVWGYKKVNATHLFVSCGTGAVDPPLRIGSYSEIMHITIDFTKHD